MRYIAVIHNYFVDSNGFDVINLESHEFLEAEKEAKAICLDKYNTFNRTDYVLIEISDKERLVKRNIFGRAFIHELPEDDNS